MRLYTIARIHRLAGLTLGGVLILLAVTGFLLDHDRFSFLWDIRLDNGWLPEAAADNSIRHVTAYKVEPENPDRRYVGSRLGLFVSGDGGLHWEHALPLQVFMLEPDRAAASDDYTTLYAATNDGIHASTDHGHHWRRVALAGQAVESMVVFDHMVYAIVDKRALYRIDPGSGKADSLALRAPIRSTEVTLSRLIRDLHYGRGLFSGDSSLLINDWSAWVLAFLGLSGLWIYLRIRAIRRRRVGARRGLDEVRKLHSNSVVLLTFVPLLLLLVTGVFLDHATALRGFMKHMRLSTEWLPPVYRSLETDLWGLDYDGETFRVGNRLGVFRTNNLKDWQLDSPGFAWKMRRIDSVLYVAGMGAPNRKLEKHEWWKLAHTPHMPRDVYLENDRAVFLGRDRESAPPLPGFSRTPLYAVLLSLHDGSFFHEQWVWVNDAAAGGAIVLFITGFIKWRTKKRRY